MGLCSPMIRRHLSTYMGAQMCNSQVLTLTSFYTAASPNLPRYSATPGHLWSMHRVCFRLHVPRCIALLGGPVCDAVTCSSP